MSSWSPALITWVLDNIGQPVINIGQPVINIGQPVIKIGQPVINIDQVTISIVIIMMIMTIMTRMMTSLCAIKWVFPPSPSDNQHCGVAHCVAATRMVPSVMMS